MASASDNFNRSNSAGLGANWTPVTNNFNIVSNRARKQGGVDSDGLCIYNATLPDTANQRVSVSIYTDVQSGYSGVAARCTENTYYELVANATESYLFRYNGGTPTQLGATGAGIANGTQIRLEVTGTDPVVLRAYSNSGSGWNPITSLGTDGEFADSHGSRITLAGRWGIAGFGIASANADSDDWSAEDIASGSVPTITDSGDESHRVGEVGVAITGTNFGASQDGGFVRICPSNDIDDANGVNQTVTAWGDTGITINIVGGASPPLPRNTNVYLFVENDAGDSNASGYVIQLTPPIAVLAYPILFLS